MEKKKEQEMKEWVNELGKTGGGSRWLKYPLMLQTRWGIAEDGVIWEKKSY